jgi:hypothetical protein
MVLCRTPYAAIHLTGQSDRSLFMAWRWNVIDFRGLNVRLWIVLPLLPPLLVKRSHIFTYAFAMVITAVLAHG